jgi:hypothetical protein
MFRRRRPLLRAAAIGGGAYVAGRHVARQSAARDQAEDDQNARLAYLEQQAVIAQPVPVAAGPAPTAPASAVSIPEQLDQLATLRRQGTLSDDEFTTAKARLLSS